LVAGAAAAAGVAAAGSAIAAPSAFSGAGSAPGATPALMTGGIAQWKAAVGTRFLVTGGGDSAAMLLQSVEPLRRGTGRVAGAGRAEAFAVFFDAAAGQAPVAPNGTTRFFHPAYGTFDLVLSGRSEAAGRARYVAIFS
jgi:hypothetical protein